MQLFHAGDLSDICTPFFALPAEMLLADDFNAKIRDRLVSEVHLSFNNREFDPDSPYHSAALAGLPAGCCWAMTMWRSCSARAIGREIYVIGTGPSLERHFAASGGGARAG